MEQPAHEEAIPRRWKVSGIAAALSAFLLVSLAIHVSTHDVTYGTRLWGSSRLEVGEGTALRVGARLRARGEFAPAEVHVALVAADGMRRPLAEALPSGPTGLVETVLRLPGDVPPGAHHLEVRVETDAGPAETASFPVTVSLPGELEPEAWAALRPVCEESSSRRPEGGWHPARRCRPEPRPAWLYPAAGHLVADVAGEIHVWLPPAAGDETPGADGTPDVDGTPDARAPADALPPPPATVEIVPLLPTGPGTDGPAPAGDPIPARLGALGLGSFTYTPVFPRGSLLVRAEGLEERIWLRDLPAAISATAPSPIVRPGEAVDLWIGTRQPDRAVFVDAWTEGRWNQVTSGFVRGDGGALTFEVPSASRGLVLVRIAAHPDGAGAATVALWADPAGPTGEVLGALARRLVALPGAEPLAAYAADGPDADPLAAYVAGQSPERLATLTPTEVRAAASALLSRVEPASPSPPLLGDTTGEKLVALDAWKARVRRPLMASLVLLAASVLFGGTFLVVSYQRRVKARLAALDLDEDDDGDGPPPGAITDGGWLAPTAMLLVVVAAGVAALLVFLETLRWDRGDVFAARAREAAAERAPTE